MQRISNLVNKRLFSVKTDRKGKQKQSRIGRLHMAVFSPDGRDVVGFMVSLPDIAGMVKRPDRFVALDAFVPDGDGARVTRPDDGFDDAARARLALDWDACIMWAGMDARTVSGKDLGFVSDAVFDEKSGAVARLCVGDGGVAESLVGAIEIPVDMLKGYEKGYMVVSNDATKLTLSGGAAAAAGEGYARAKATGRRAAAKADEAAASAVDKGSLALGRALGKAKRAIESVGDDDDRAGRDAEKSAPVPATDVRVSPPASAGELKSGERQTKKTTYAPARKGSAQPSSAAAKAGAKTAGAKTAGTKKAAAKKPAAKKGTAAKGTKKRSTGNEASRAVGKQVSKMGGMFGAFVDEYKKASK